MLHRTLFTVITYQLFWHRDKTNTYEINEEKPDATAMRNFYEIFHFTPNVLPSWLSLQNTDIDSLRKFAPALVWMLK